MFQSRNNFNESPSFRGKESFVVELLELFPLVGMSLLTACQTLALIGTSVRYAILVVGFCLTLIYIFFHLNLLIKRPRFLALWFMFAAGGEFLNTILQLDPFLFKQMAFRGICHVLFLGGIIFGLRQVERESYTLTWINRLPMLLAWGGGIVGLITYLRNVDAMMLLARAERFAGAEDLHPVGIAYGLGGAIVLASCFLFFDRNWWSRFFHFSIILLLSKGIVSAGSRGALVAVAFAIGLMLVCRMTQASVKERVWLAGMLLALCVAILFVLGSSDLVREQVSFLSRRFEGLEDASSDTSTNARIELWHHYWSQVDSWALTGFKNYAGPYPHNLAFEFWLRFGILGLMTVIACVGVIVRGYWLFLTRKWSVAAYAGFGLLLFGFMNGQFNLSLEFNRLFWGGLGMGVAIVFAQRKHEDSFRK